MALSKRALSLKPSSTLSISDLANTLKSAGYDIVGFTTGEPDFDTPEHIKEAAIAAISEGFTKYTANTGIIPLREAIKNKLKNENNLDYNVSEIVVSNGGKQALCNAFLAILNENDEVIIPAPYWLSYPQMVQIAGGKPVVVETTMENNYKMTIADLEKVYTKKTKAIVLNSPSNPTGMIYTKKELTEIADFAVSKNLYVISDEIYEKLIYTDEKHISIASLNDEIFKKTITVNGLSKAYAMTGWRVGYIAASKDIIKLVDNIQSHMTSNINSIAQKAALAAITGDQSCVTKMKDEFKRRREYIYEEMSKIKELSIVKPDGAFYLLVDISSLFGKYIHGKQINTVEDFASVLLSASKVAIIPCTDFGAPKCVRLSYATSMEQIEKGVERIKEFLRCI